MAVTLSMLPHLRRLIDPSALDLGSDAVLLSRFVHAHDEAAFAVLVARHGPMVLRVCRRVLGDVHTAEDVCQAVFLVLVRKAAGIHHAETLAAWLHGVAHRLALKARAVEARRRQAETRSLQIAPSPPVDPLTEVSGRELLTILDAELQRLPKRYRLPLILCCLEGRSQPEAARLLGWTPGSVKGRLERGRSKLHQRLLRRGLTLPAALLALEAAQGAATARMPTALTTSIMQVAAGGVSAGVAALAEGGIAGMVGMKMKLAFLLMLTLGAVTASVGLLTQSGLVARPAEEKPAAQPNTDPPKAQAPKAAKEQARLDRYGDPLPAGAIARLGTIRLRRAYDVFPLPDRDAFLSISVGEHMAVCVWRMTTGELLHSFQFPARRRQAALSPDGKTLAVAVYNQQRTAIRVILLDVRSGKRTVELAGVGSVQALAFAPGGKTIAVAGGDRTLRLWDRDSGTELRRFTGTKTNWWSLAFSPDGKILASAAVQKRTIRLWDTATGRELRALGDDGSCLISTVVFSPDGKTVATAALDDKIVRLWDVGTGKEIRRFQSILGIISLAFSPDGKILAAGCTPEGGKIQTNNPIYLWDVDSGKEIRRLPGHVLTVSSLAFSSDGKRLVSGSGSSVARVWDVATGKELLPFAEHESYVESVAFSPDGRFLASGGLDTIRLWKPAAGELARIFEGGVRPLVSQVTFSPDGKTLVSNGPDGSLRLWDVATGRQKRRFKVTEEDIAPTFASSPDGRTLAVRRKDGTIRLLDAVTGEEKRRLTGGANDASFLCFSPDSAKLASQSISYRGKNGVLHLWDVATGEEKHKWTVQQPGPVVFSPDGRSLFGVDGGDSLPGIEKRTFHVWDTASGEDRPFQVVQQAKVFSVAISPDGRMLAGGDIMGTITFWDVTSGQVRRRLKGHLYCVRTLAFSPDGKTLASGSADTTVLLWDATGRPAAVQAGPLSAKRLRTLWDDLANQDAGKAFDAIGLLTAMPEQAVPLLKSKLRPAPEPAERRHVARLIADLDSEEFAVREKAKEQLRQLGERAEPGLRDALKDKLPLEARKRIEELLEGVRAAVASPEYLRNLRAAEVLEHVGTPEAQEVLKTLANGTPTARLTREAKASLRRLKLRGSIQSRDRHSSFKNAGVFLVPKRCLGTDLAKRSFASASSAIKADAKRSFADGVPKQSLGTRKRGNPTPFAMLEITGQGAATPTAP